MVREEDRIDRIDTNGGDGEVEDTLSVEGKSGIGSGGERGEADGWGNEDLLAGQLGGGDNAVRASDACGWGGDGEMSSKEERRSVCDARGEGAHVIGRWSEDAEFAHGIGDEDEEEEEEGNDALIKGEKVVNEDRGEEGDGE